MHALGLILHPPIGRMLAVLDLNPVLRAAGAIGAIGFTQRACRLKWPFCVVPRKEGGPRFAQGSAEGRRPLALVIAAIEDGSIECW